MKSLLRPKAGDLFYIPAKNADGTDGFVIARYIELIEYNIGHLIEVFAHFYTEPPDSIEDVDKSSRLFRPIMWDMCFFKPYPRWKILFSDQNYDKSQSDYENIALAFDAGNVWIGGQNKKVSQEVFDSFEPSICWSIDNLITRTNAHLSGIFSADEKYDYHRLPEHMRPDAPVASTAIKALALKMDQRFQAWQTKSRKR